MAGITNNPLTPVSVSPKTQKSKTRTYTCPSQHPKNIIIRYNIPLGGDYKSTSFKWEGRDIHCLLSGPGLNRSMRWQHAFAALWKLLGLELSLRLLVSEATIFVYTHNNTMVQQFTDLPAAEGFGPRISSQVEVTSVTLPQEYQPSYSI